MATITAAAGGGNWTVGGTWVGGVAPTAADDAVLDGTSGAVTINAGAVARSLDCTGYTNTLTHTAGVTLALGDATAGAGNVALLLVSGMTYTLGNSATSALSFASTSATVQTIATGGKTLGNWTIAGVGSSYQLVSTNTTSSAATVTVNAGTLDTNGQTCSWALFNSATTTNARTLTFGSSAITLSGASGTVLNAAATNLTVSANTATMTLTGTAATIAGASVNWNGLSVIMTGSGTATVGTNTFGNFTRTGTAAKIDALSFNGNLTVTGTVAFNGNSAINRLQVISSTAGTARTITAATVSGTNVDFMDITGAGAASWNLSAITGGSGDCGGNSGITFTTPATQTHATAAAGNWSDVTKWTSRVPLPQDDVVIDGNATGTIVADMPRLGKSINFTGFAGTASFTSTPNSLFGSWTSGSGMTISGTQTLTLAGRVSTYTITSNGKQFTQQITVNNFTGTYSLADAFSSTLALAITAGTLTTNGIAVTCSSLTVSGATAVINMGASIVSLTSTAAVNIVNVGSGAIVNAGTSEIIIANASASTRTIFCSGRTLATVTYTVAGSTGTLVLSTSASTIGTLNFSDATNARTLQLPAASTTIFGTFNVNGGPGRIVTINSSTPASAATIFKSSGVVSCDYLSIQDSSATGAAGWYAGANSVKGSNVTGWFFTAIPNFMEFI